MVDGEGLAVKGGLLRNLSKNLKQGVGKNKSCL